MNPFVFIFSGVALIGVGVVQLVLKPKGKAAPKSGVPSFKPQKTTDEQLAGEQNNGKKES